MTNNTKKHPFYDSEEKDFRKRYTVPEIWMLDPYSYFGVEYNVYTSKIVNLLPDERLDILDAGCGSGRISSLIAEKGHNVIGIDYSERAIQFAKGFVPTCDFYQIDLRELSDCKDFHNRFDIAVLIDVIEHIPPSYHEKVILGLSMGLRSNGSLILSVPSIHRVPINKWHYKHFTLGEIEKLLEQAGMEIKEVHFDYKICVTQFLIHKIWRLAKNKYWDLKVFRRNVLKPLYEKFIANPSKASKAGRYIIVAQRKTFDV